MTVQHSIYLMYAVYNVNLYVIQLSILQDLLKQEESIREG